MEAIFFHLAVSGSNVSPLPRCLLPLCPPTANTSPANKHRTYPLSVLVFIFFIYKCIISQTYSSSVWNLSTKSVMILQNLSMARHKLRVESCNICLYFSDQQSLHKLVKALISTCTKQLTIEAADANMPSSCMHLHHLVPLVFHWMITLDSLVGIPGCSTSTHTKQNTLNIDK